MYKVLTNKAHMQFMCPFMSLGCMTNKCLCIHYLRNCLWKGRDLHHSPLLHQHADGLVDRVYHQDHSNPYIQASINLKLSQKLITVKFEFNNDNIGINLKSCVWYMYWLFFAITNNAARQFKKTRAESKVPDF